MPATGPTTGERSATDGLGELRTLAEPHRLRIVETLVSNGDDAHGLYYW
jgi:hypothetical protein